MNIAFRHNKTVLFFAILMAIIQQVLSHTTSDCSFVGKSIISSKSKHFTHSSNYLFESRDLFTHVISKRSGGSSWNVIQKLPDNIGFNTKSVSASKDFSYFALGINNGYSYVNVYKQNNNHKETQQWTLIFQEQGGNYSSFYGFADVVKISEDGKTLFVTEGHNNVIVYKRNEEEEEKARTNGYTRHAVITIPEIVKIGSIELSSNGTVFAVLGQLENGRKVTVISKNAKNEWVVFCSINIPGAEDDMFNLKQVLSMSSDARSIAVSSPIEGCVRIYQFKPEIIENLMCNFTSQVGDVKLDKSGQYLFITIPNDGTVTMYKKNKESYYEWNLITSLQGISKFGSVLSLDNNNSLLVASPEEERIYEYELVCQNDNALVQCFGKTVSDPQVCSGHGDCVAPNFCMCRSGYHGYDCFNEYIPAVTPNADNEFVDGLINSFKRTVIKKLKRNENI